MLRGSNSASLLLLAALAPALSGCETVNTAANQAVGSTFEASLSGANEVQTGDSDGAGMARIALNDTTNQVCTRLEVRNLSPVTAAHIHQGKAGENGPPVVPLDVPDDDDSNDCDTVPAALFEHIRRAPGDFYVNVHTADFPAGAIRGQITEVGS